MHVFGTELIRSLAIWLAESRDYHLYIYKHGPAATDSYCDVTMAHCSHGYLWTHDIEVGASWRDCDNEYEYEYEIFIASGTNIKYMETTCNKDMENDKQN